MQSNSSEFQKACQDVLAYLNSRQPMGVWMITRTSGDQWVVLVAEDSHYNVKPHDVFKWSDSFCCRMVQGLGPSIAPDSTKVESYCEAPIGRAIEIGAYIGMPLVDSDGLLFGTLCAVDPKPISEDAVSMQPELELISKMLMHVYHSELQASIAVQLSEKLNSLQWIDAETGVMNSSCWEIDSKSIDSSANRFGDINGLVYVQVSDVEKSELASLISQITKFIDKHGTVYRISKSEFVAAISNRTLEWQQNMMKSLSESTQELAFVESLSWQIIPFGKRSNAILSEMRSSESQLPRKTA